MALKKHGSDCTGNGNKKVVFSCNELGYMQKNGAASNTAPFLFIWWSFGERISPTIG